MKKLLSLLSVLAISGSAVPTTIAASPYQKKQSIRVKRETKNNKPKIIFNTNGVDTPSQQQIKEKIIKKYPHIKSDQIKVKNITINSVSITINGLSGEKILYFKVDKSVPINEIIINSNLGEIDVNDFGGDYDEQLFKHFLKQLNSQLDINKINVIDISTYTAKVISNDTRVYTGEIDINYSLPVKLIFKNTELGSIRNNGLNLPTEQQIKDRLKELNPNLADIINEFEVKNITPTYAKISYKQKDILSGEVVVNFTSNINLNKIITNNNLGEFKTENLSNPTKQQIKNKLKEMYNNLDIRKINVENISNNNAIINSFDTNTYTGNINVNYSVSIDSLNWE